MSTRRVWPVVMWLESCAGFGMNPLTMRVSRQEILSRGLHLRCPSCGAKSLFASRRMRINRDCPRCGLVLDRGEGFYLGPMVINYGIAVFGFVAPCIILWVAGVLPGLWAGILAVTACIGLPIALYRLSWSLWLAVYFFVLPDRLPSNCGTEHDRLEG